LGLYTGVDQQNQAAYFTYGELYFPPGDLYGSMNLLVLVP